MSLPIRDRIPLRRSVFTAGDVRANENIALTAMHTLFLANTIVCAICCSSCSRR